MTVFDLLKPVVPKPLAGPAQVQQRCYHSKFRRFRLGAQVESGTLLAPLICVECFYTYHPGSVMA